MKRLIKISLWILIIISETFGALIFILPMSVGVANEGTVLGILFFSLCLVITLAHKIFFKIIRAVFKRRVGKIFLIFISVFLAVGIAYAATLSIFMLNAMHSEPENPDVVIVAGCRVKPDGEPSLMLQKRVEAAYEFLSLYPDIPCVVSGGKGDDEPLSESEVMKAMLIGMGIDKERITTETESKNTRQNIEFSLRILKEQGTAISEAVIVSDGFHILRASLITNEYGVSASAISSDTPLWLVSPYWVREWAAITVEKLNFIFNHS